MTENFTAPHLLLEMHVCGFLNKIFILISSGNPCNLTRVGEGEPIAILSFPTTTVYDTEYTHGSTKSTYDSRRKVGLKANASAVWGHYCTYEFCVFLHLETLFSARSTSNDLAIGQPSPKLLMDADASNHL
jgi:hypothetical protein